MSAFQGPGTGISGTSNQFSVGYAGNAGYSGYAPTAGNINGYAPSAGYANNAFSATNIQSAQGINGTSWAWSGQGGTPGHLWGGNVGSQYAVWQYGQMYMGSSGYANSSGSAGNTNYSQTGGYATNLNVQGIGATNWNWIGQNGTPSWLWGSNNGSYIPVWQVGNSYVGSTGYAPNASYVGTANATQNRQWYSANSAIAVYNQGNDTATGNINVGLIPANSMYYGNGLYTGYTIQFYIQGTIVGFLNTKRTSGGTTGDRFLIYYNPENNLSQYGYWNGGWSQQSDAREKENIEDLDPDSTLTFIKSLRPRKFKWKTENGMRTGLIAQEVLSAALETKDESYLNLVAKSKEYIKNNGSLDITNLAPITEEQPCLSVSQMEIVSPLVKTVQNLMKDVEEMKRVVSVMKKINVI